MLTIGYLDLCLRNVKLLHCTQNEEEMNTFNRSVGMYTYIYIYEYIYIYIHCIFTRSNHHKVLNEICKHPHIKSLSNDYHHIRRGTYTPSQANLGNKTTTTTTTKTTTTTTTTQQLGEHINNTISISKPWDRLNPNSPSRFIMCRPGGTN